MASALSFNLRPASRRNMGDFGFDVQGGGKKLKGGSNQEFNFSLKKVEHAAVVMVVLGIIASLLNTISNLYIYYSCHESGCDTDEDGAINSFVGAQYNIILLSIIALGVFGLYHKKRNE